MAVCVCASYCVDMGVLMRVPLGGSVCVCVFIILCGHGCAHESTSRWQCVCVCIILCGHGCAHEGTSRWHVCVCASYCVNMGVLMRVPLGGSVCVGNPGLDKVSDINVICGVLSSFLKSLKEPILTFRMHPIFVKASGIAVISC